MKIRLLPAAILLLAVAGCGATPGSAAAGDAAEALLRAHQDGDGSAACALLAPETAAEVARSAGRPCPEAITGEDLPAPAAVTGVTVDGQWAKVVVGADAGTLFLAMFPGGWRVAAAGCRPRGERPYDCTVHGG
ncbi:hypothetical protein ACQP00_25290 [Dactylosporangium sp. CS-047395]|uniref:hypothetical protein n=1 Tax=Dactylosporangium sp. CS-047395 TaxID=3239936 RepID=UPI003D93ACA8